MESRALTRAFDRLDAGSKALLHVSLHHRVPDERLVHVLRTTPDHIEERRDAALRHLAAELDLDGEDPAGAARRALEALPAEQWAELAGGGPAAAAVKQPLVPSPPPAEPHTRTARALLREPSLSGEPELEPDEAPPPRAAAPPPPRRRREPPSGRLIAAAALVVALVAAGVGLAVALSSGGDDDNASTRQAGTTAAPPPVRLTPAPGAPAGAAATARLTGAGGRTRLELAARGLPATRDSYELWLFNSVADAVPLAQLSPGGAPVRVLLPARYRAYRYLDVSREPRDGNPNHSGVSVLRTPIADLAG